MTRITGPKPATHMEPVAPNYANADGVDTLKQDPVNGHRIDFRADYRSIEVSWTGGTGYPTDAPAGGPFGVYLDGKKVDLEQGHRYGERDGEATQVSSETWVSIPKGSGEAKIEVRQGDEVLSRVTVDRQGLMKRTALGIADFRDQANIIAGMDDGFLGAMSNEDAAGLAKRAGVHLVKALTPDLMIRNFAGGLGIDKSLSLAIGQGVIGLGGDILEAGFQGIAALTNGIGAVYKGLMP